MKLQANAFHEAEVGWMLSFISRETVCRHEVIDEGLSVARPLVSLRPSDLRFCLGCRDLAKSPQERLDFF